MTKTGTAQVKDIKPGVLSKIFTLSEMGGTNIEDESLRELFKASHKLQKCLLNFANYKPLKKGEKGKNVSASDVIDQGIKDLVDKIVKFNTLYKKQKEVKATQKKPPVSKRQVKPKTLHSPSFAAQTNGKKVAPLKKRPIRKCVKRKPIELKEEYEDEAEDMRIRIKNPGSSEIKEENLIGEICSFFSKVVPLLTPEEPRQE